ncbi:DUF5710 domain-containing protein [uncultured Thomasclavelia sp.]|nr:DUF5710 domain-containing protein [uncultured Thomasclavelia sp.]
MSLLLNVPFAEKDEVKRLGAWWNPEHKTLTLPFSPKHG